MAPPGDLKDAKTICNFEWKMYIKINRCVLNSIQLFLPDWGWGGSLGGSWDLNGF